jgi:CHAT domain-containing protein
MRRSGLFLFVFVLVSSFGWGQDTLIVTSLYQQGKELYYDGRYREAQQLLLQALELKEQEEGPEDEQLMELYLRLGKNERYLRIHSQALHYLEKGRKLAVDLFGENSEEEADFFYEIGSTYSQMYDPDKADTYFEQCMEIYRRVHGPESSEVGNMYMNLGINAMKATHYYDAERYLQQAFEVFQRSSDPQSQDFNRIYSNTGYLYRKMGNYDQAIEYGQKALEIKLLHYEPNHPSVAKYHRNIGRALQEKGEAEKALPYMKRTVEILEASLGAGHATTGGSYAELAGVYADLHRFDEALGLYRRANRILEQSLSPTHPYLVGGYFNIGRVLEEMGAGDLALQHYEEALQRFQAATYVPANLVAQTRGQMAEVYRQAGDLNKALDYIQEAMKALVPEFESADPYANPSVENVQNVLALLKLLQSKAAILDQLFDQTKNRKDLEHSFRALELAVDLVEKFKKSYFTEADRKTLARQTSDLFQQAVKQAFRLYQLTDDPEYLEKAFNFSEKGKSSLLWHSLNAAYALEASDLPKEDLDSLESWKSQIAALQEQLLEEGLNDQDRSRLLDLNIRYGTTIEGLEKFNPGYYRLKYGVPQLKVQDLANHLPDEKTGLLEYFYDEEYFYFFLITKQGIQGFQSSRSDDFDNYLREVRADKPSVSGDVSPYLAALDTLYQILIAPCAAELTSLTDLVIVPHGMLQYLPFELLASTKGEDDFRKIPYLLESHVIQYAWSADLWLRPPLRKKAPSVSFLGFAPEFPQGGEMASRSALAALPNAAGEIASASRYFSGEVFLGEQATESNFLALAPESKILHLATHAQADDREPLRSGLWFSALTDTLEDGYLNALEIYHLNLSADLAVMSACNTGSGQLEEGEGVMSLGRAFSYAGCRSVLMSLWLADDVSTSKIMDHFYEEMAAGQSRTNALQRAKQEYLEQADALTAHPYYWAHLVVVGENNPITAPSRIWMGGLALAGVLVLGGGIWFWKRKRS